MCCCTILLTNFLPCYINTSTLRACLHGGGGLQVGEVTCGGSPHLSCKRDQIKMRDYMDRRVTPPKRVTSSTWGPPLPCKQASSHASPLCHPCDFFLWWQSFFFFPAFANPRDGSPQEIDDPNAKLFFIWSQEPANFALTGRLKLLLVPERKLVPPAASILNHPENQVHSFRLSR